MSIRSSNFARHGLTFVELTIGMSITAVLMLALATFATAVSTGWKYSETQYMVRSVGNQSVAQLRGTLSDVLCVLQAKTGDSSGAAAYLFCWRSDTWGGAADLKAQFGEMSLVEYDPSTRTIWLYEPKDSADMTASEKTTAADANWGDSSSEAIITYFKSSSMLKSRRPLVGGASASGGAQVTSAQFGYYAATNGKPVAIYQLSIVTDGALSYANDNVPMRAAQTPSNVTFSSTN